MENARAFASSKAAAFDNKFARSRLESTNAQKGSETTEID